MLFYLQLENLLQQLFHGKHILHFLFCLLDRLRQPSMVTELRGRLLSTEKSEKICFLSEVGGKEL